MSKSKKDAEPVEAASFEEALASLETIVAALEDGQIPLADAIAQYEQGIKLLRHCYQSLSVAERRIELLSRVDSEGRVESEPFDDSALSLEQKAQSRAKRRSRTAQVEPESSEDEIDGPRRLF